MFFLSGYFYFITIGLQAICVIHCLRRGNQNKWIWLIVFLPLIGCIVYIFTEMVTGNEIQKVQTGIGSILNPGGNIKRLEENLRFSDTFNNKVQLADAYLAEGHIDEAIELYESSLTHAFEENEYVHAQLIIAYYEKQRYTDLISVAKKIYRLPQFARSKSNMLYAIALGYTGNNELAEKEFKKMKSRFAYFEPRYQYGMFLKRSSRIDEARSIFSEMLEEGSHLSPREKRSNRVWLNKAKEELQSV